MRRLCVLLLAVFACSSVLVAQDVSAPDTIFVADRFIHSKSTAGASVSAKFHTAELRAATMRLDAPIDTVDGRVWTLSDILVSADFNGNGYIAAWIVAGPAGVIERYAARLRETASNRELIYDYGIRTLIVRCACD